MLDRVRSWFAGSSRYSTAHAMTQAAFKDFNDPAFKEFLRGELAAGGGALGISVTAAMRNPSVFRANDLLTGSIGMLPLGMVKNKNQNAEQLLDHPLAPLLMHKPNPWMTALQFKKIMQFNLLTRPEGAVARIARDNRGRITGLLPVHHDHLRIDQYGYDEPRYFLRATNGGETEVLRQEILHLRDSWGEIASGVGSRLQQAADAINLAQSASMAAKSIFDNGFRPGGVVSHPKTLSEPAREKIRAAISGSKGANKSGSWIVLEEGVDVKPMLQSAGENQTIEQRKMQIEEIARIYAIPRPLMGIDDTSWGSGIEQLAHLFVRFTLNYWFRVWEDGLNAALLTRDELAQGISTDFGERELLRGTTKELAAFLSKALGAGGQPAFMTANEARDEVGLPHHEDGDALFQGAQSVTHSVEPDEDDKDKP